MSKKEIIVGIDLGTTNSVVSILESGLPKTIAIDGQPLLFSVVSLVDGSFVVGREARNMALLEPENTISSIKRKMGQDVKVQIGDKMMRPEEISALILKRIWKEVKAYKNLSDNAGIRSVITVPAYFTEEQRKATKEAAELAGFTVERIINEPTAAALAFGMSKLEEATYAIYDFGGGTFDVSVIESNEGLVEVLASGGNNRLGGDDLDEILANYIWTEFKTKNKLKDVELTAKEKNRLIRIAETTKVKLSTQHEVLIKESFFYKRGENHLHLELLLTNTKFEELIQSKIEETVKHLQHTIEDANVGRGDLTGILLVGGSSRIPLVSRMIEKALNLSPELIPNPDEAVSHGATVQGAIIDGIDLNTVLVDITPYSLGTSTISDELKFFSARLQKMEADEEFEEREHLIMSVIIPKNTPIPTKKTKTYYSVAPFQKEYELDVLQGEQKISIGNRQIGKTTLEIKKPVEDGEVEVTFELDINGILHMQATEIKTKESVTAQFKSAKGKTVSKAELLDNDVIIAEESLLISRGGKLLKSDAIPEEDKEELSGLLENLKSQKTENDHAAMEDTEQQILDLLFYLESGNEDEG